MVPRFASPYRQRGAIGLMAALTLGMALLFMLLVIDSGRLYMEQRKLQRVVDAAALEASNRNAVCSGTGVNALTQATTSAARNGFTVGSGNTLTATCGTLSTGSNNLRAFTANATATQAIQVVANETVATSVAAGLWGMVSGGAFATTTVLRAQATAGYVGNPLAQLNIRSGLANISTSQSALLNTLIGGLLGGSINLSAVQYQGLVDTNINLLSYLNQAAITAGISAGDYTSLLTTDISVTKLVQAAATLVQQNGAAASITTALGQISAIGKNSTIKLGDLIQTTTGSSTAGLDGTLQLFQLVQGIVQVAGSGNAINLSSGISVPGLVGLTTQVSVIEPPQFSAVGNPMYAHGKGTGQIYVRTAQVRVLLTLQLTVVSGLSSTVNLALGPLSDLLQLLGCLNGCVKTTYRLLPAGATLSIGIEGGTAEAYVTDYTCPPASKTLSVESSSSAAVLRAGSINSNNFFSSSSPSDATPLPLIALDTTTCKSLLSCDPTVPFGGGGLGLEVNSPLGTSGTGTTTVLAHTYTSPPNVSTTSQNYTYTSGNIVGSLSNTLGGIKLYQYPALVANPSGDLLSALGKVVTTLIGSVGTVVVNLLSTLVDPLLNNLLTLLGVDLVPITVGANLTCQTGRAQLVL